MLPEPPPDHLRLPDDVEEPLQDPLLPLCDRHVFFEPEPEDQLPPLLPELMLSCQLQVPLRLFQLQPLEPWPMGQPWPDQREYFCQRACCRSQRLEAGFQALACVCMVTPARASGTSRERTSCTATPPPTTSVAAAAVIAALVVSAAPILVSRPAPVGMAAEERSGKGRPWWAGACGA
jgi:hypothetical protein